MDPSERKTSPTFPSPIDFSKGPTNKQKHGRFTSKRTDGKVPKFPHSEKRNELEGLNHSSRKRYTILSEKEKNELKSQQTVLQAELQLPAELQLGDSVGKKLQLKRLQLKEMASCYQVKSDLFEQMIEDQKDDRKTISKKDAIIASLQKEISSLKSKKRKRSDSDDNDDTEKLREELQTARAKIDQNEGALDGKRRRISHLEDKVEDLGNEVECMDIEIAEVEHLINLRDKRVIELKDQLKGNQAQIIGLENQLKNKEAELKELQKVTVTELDKISKDIETEREDRKKTFSALTTEKDDLKKQKDQLEIQLESLESQIKKAEEDREASTKKMAEQNDDLKKQKDQLEIQFETLRLKIKGAEADHKKMAEQHDEKCMVLSREKDEILENAKKREGDLNNIIKELEEKNTQKDTELTQSKAAHIQTDIRSKAAKKVLDEVKKVITNFEGKYNNKP